MIPKIILRNKAIHREPELTITQTIARILDDSLGLNGRSTNFTRDTPLLGALPELDSMAVVGLITALEDQLGLVMDDDELDAAMFATLGSLCDFVSAKVAA